MLTDAEAIRFVEDADFSGLPNRQSVFGVLGAPAFEPDADKDQWVVAGSGINSFVKGVTAERRNALNDSALFAQLMANKKVPDQTNITGWYDVYFDTLSNIGWVLQSRNFAEFHASSDDLDVNEAILTVASGIVGGTATVGYQLIKQTLDSLQKLSDKSPWLTTFSRESQHERAARFQVSLLGGNPDDDFLVTLLAFELQATSTLEQLLFLKFKSTEVTLKQYSGAVTINERLLSSLSARIAAKVDEFAGALLSEALDLEPQAPAKDAT